MMNIDRVQGLIDVYQHKVKSRDAVLVMVEYLQAQGELSGEDVRAVTEAMDAYDATNEPVSLPGLVAEKAALTVLVEETRVAAAQVMDDAQVLEYAGIWAAWAVGVMYARGVVVSFDGTLYRVEQAHTSQAHQVPGGEGMLAIYRPVQREAEPGAVLPWVSGEAVETGERREFEGVVYECIAAGGAGANIWTPPTVPAIWEVAG